MQTNPPDPALVALAQAAAPALEGQRKQHKRPPSLTPHLAWPFPGMTPDDSARADLVRSEAYFNMLADCIKTGPRGQITAQQLLALVPAEWKAVCGRYTHARLPFWAAAQRGVETIYVSHDDGGFHMEYRLAIEEKVAA